MKRFLVKKLIAQISLVLVLVVGVTVHTVGVVGVVPTISIVVIPDWLFR